MESKWLPDEIEHSSCTKSTKKRSSRASAIQKHELMKYFEDRPGAFLVSGNSAGDTRAKQRVWIELAHKLNGVEGALKPTARWAKYWNDLVLYTKTRAHQAVNEGKDYVRSSRPSEFDQRLLRIVGKDDLLQAWLALCATSTKEETREGVLEELNDDFEWSESLDESVQEFRESSGTVQNTIEGTSASNPDMYEEFDELIDDSDAVLMRDSNISIDEGLHTNADEDQQIEYVEEFEVVLPQVENLSDPSIQTANKRKRRHSQLTNGEGNEADNSDDNEEDNAISKAISVLGSACHSLSVALEGLAEVIAKRKKRRH